MCHERQECAVWPGWISAATAAVRAIQVDARHEHVDIGALIRLHHAGCGGEISRVGAARDENVAAAVNGNAAGVFVELAAQVGADSDDFGQGAGDESGFGVGSQKRRLKTSTSIQPKLNH